MSLEMSFRESLALPIAGKLSRPILALTTELHRAGVRPVDIAREEKVSTAHVAKVMSGQTVSLRIRKRIAKILKKSVEEIWAA